MGGQFDYFGLWIDDTFNTGHSKAAPKSTTYNSPQLSAAPEFEVDTIEVWGIQPQATENPEVSVALFQGNTLLGNSTSLNDSRLPAILIVSCQQFKSKVVSLSRGWPEGSLFNSYDTKV